MSTSRQVRIDDATHTAPVSGTDRASGMAGPPAGPVLQARRKRGVGLSAAGWDDREGGGSSYAYKQIHYLSNDARRSVRSFGRSAWAPR